MTWRRRLGLALGCLLAATVAGASERSKALSAHGLVEFHAGRYREALGFLDQAVADDPKDTQARYIRAAARGHLRDYEGAVADLELVLAAQPDLDQAALDLGVALIELKRYRDAQPWLEQARRVPALEGRACLFLGIAHLRLGERQAAAENFDRAARDPEYTVIARYYQGVTAYQQGHWEEAEERFTDVIQASPDSAIGREAAEFLTKLDEAGHRRAGLYAAVAFMYDSNVIVAPSTDAGAAEDVLGVSDKGDFGMAIAAGGNVVPWRTDTVQLALGYDFYQSLYADLHEFDLQDHGPNAQIAVDLGALRLALTGRYDYYFLEDDSFLQEATALPWATIPQANGRTELFYRMLRRDYKQRDYSVRDAFNHAVNVRHFFYLGSPDRSLSVGYQFDYEDPVISRRLVNDAVFTAAEARSYGYHGNEANAGISWVLPSVVVGELNFGYRHERYVSASADFTPSGDRRNDDEYVISVAFRRPFGEYITLLAGYVADLNDSNDPRFEYDRHIVSVALEGRY